jgi:hypothetical protein
MFRSKPATYTLVLQVGMESLGKSLITTGVADETRVVVNGLADERANIRDEGVINTCPFEKSFWNVAFGVVDRINADGRRVAMRYRLKTLHCSQVNVIESCPSDGGTGEVGSAQIRSAEGSSAEIRFPEVGSAQVGSVEIGSAQIRSAEMGSAQIGSSEGGFPEVGKEEIGSALQLHLLPHQL